MVGPELFQVWAECEARSSGVLSRVRGTEGRLSACSPQLSGAWG